MWVPGKPVREYSTLLSKDMGINIDKEDSKCIAIHQQSLARVRRVVVFLSPGCKSVAVLGNFLKT